MWELIELSQKPQRENIMLLHFLLRFIIINDVYPAHISDSFPDHLNFVFANFWSHLIKLFCINIFSLFLQWLTKALLGVERLDSPFFIDYLCSPVNITAVSLQKTCQNLRILWIRWVNIKQGDQQAIHWAQDIVLFWDVGTNWKSKGTQDDRSTVCLLTLRMLFLGGYLWLMSLLLLLNIQAIFSILGCVYPVFERPLFLTVIDLIIWKTTHQVSAPLSFRESGVWLKYISSWSSRTMARFLYVYQKIK